MLALARLMAVTVANKALFDMRSDKTEADMTPMAKLIAHASRAVQGKHTGAAAIV